MCIKAYYDSKKFNPNASLKIYASYEIPNLDEKEPILINNEPIKYNSIFDKDNLKYYTYNGKLIRLLDFKEDKDIYLMDNGELINDLMIDSQMKNIYNKFKNNISCNYNESASIIKGSFITKLKQNYHTLHIIGGVDGNCLLWLINPKHGNDIKNKDFDDIKKWAIQIKLSSSNYCVIPTNWYYILDYNEEFIQYSITADNYFTIAFSFIQQLYN
jgi:hypothetical protein